MQMYDQEGWSCFLGKCDFRESHFPPSCNFTRKPGYESTLEKQWLVGYLLPIRGKRSTGKMSMLSAAALLDELMGVDRDRAPNEKKTALHWSDPQVIFGYFYSSLLLVICLVRFVDKTNADSKLVSFTFQVCKYFLCGFCPSQLFVNTRSDLG